MRDRQRAVADGHHRDGHPRAAGAAASARGQGRARDERRDAAEVSAERQAADELCAARVAARWAEQDGAEWTHQRANKIWKDILKEFEAPKIDIAVKDELKSFVDRRKSEGGVKTDF